MCQEKGISEKDVNRVFFKVLVLKIHTSGPTILSAVTANCDGRKAWKRFSGCMLNKFVFCFCMY